MSREKQRGVTLLELLVAITIVALLAATSLVAWRAGVSGWEKASVKLEHDRAVMAVHQVVSEQMASMMPYEVLVERVGQVMFFQGEAETARFVSRYSLANRAASGLYLIEYHVVDERDGRRQLVLQENLIRSAAELAAKVAGIDAETGVIRVRFHAFEQGPAAVVLLDGLDDCRFEYYNAPRVGVPGNWTSEWIGSANEIPTAMRIRAAKKDMGNLEPVTIAARVRNFAKRQP